jgi:ankyrin repeat protein
MCKTYFRKFIKQSLINYFSKECDKLNNKYINNDEHTIINIKNIQQKENLINTSVNEFNTSVNEFNTSVNEFNTSVNYQDKNGNTAVMIAIDNYENKKAKELIESGYNVNLENNNGDTALMILAKRYPSEELSNLLLSKEDIDIHKKNKDNQNALMISILHNNFNLFQLLVENNANID